MNLLFASLLRSARMAAVCLHCVAVFVFAGCLPKTVLQQPYVRPVPVQPVIPDPGSASSIDAAEAAYTAGNTARAEQITISLSSRPNAPPAEATRVWRILALSAQANRHPNLTLSALDRWRFLQKDVDNTREWQQIWSAALTQLSHYEATSRIMAVAQDPSRPYPLRAEAGIMLATRQWSVGDAMAAHATLNALYATATDSGQKILVEHRLFEALHTAEDSALSRLASRITPEQEKLFPAALIRLEEVRRAVQDSSNPDAIVEKITSLRQGSELADPSVFTTWNSTAPPPILPKDLVVTPLLGKSLALVLPLGGQFGNLAENIVLGAQAACKDFAAAGRPVQLTVIDTYQPDWPDKLALLPPAVTVVGGPMRTADYTTLKDRGLMHSRAFLSFLPQLSDQDEGSIAWRFFTSWEDQIHALFRLTRGLGVNQYAILMPEKDTYAARMAQLFENEARRNGASVVRTAMYPLDTPENWNKLVATFLDTNKQATAPPHVPFQAVFLPDGWRNMESLIPNLFYFRETRQVLLGTSVWEQQLTNLKVPVDARYYGLTAFPGAWRTKALTPAGETLHTALTNANKNGADFWTSLGYDFARFASTLDIQPGWTREEMNAKLHNHPSMAWSMAPIRWDASGRASQELFLFSPKPDGFAPVNMEQFRQNFEKAWSR